MLTAKEIARATGALEANAAKYRDALNEAMERCVINTPKRRAAFLATVGVESAWLSAVEEGLYYKDPARLLKIFPRAFPNLAAAAKYTRNPGALSKLLYNGYHGRGLIQLTWEDNYREAGEALGYDYVSNPNLLLQPKHAALTAAWFWESRGCNQLADDGDMEQITRRINGPAKLHLAERTEKYAANLDWMTVA